MQLAGQTRFDSHPVGVAIVTPVLYQVCSTACPVLDATTSSRCCTLVRSRAAAQESAWVTTSTVRPPLLDELLYHELSVVLVGGGSGRPLRPGESPDTRRIAPCTLRASFNCPRAR